MILRDYDDTSWARPAKTSGVGGDRVGAEKPESPYEPSVRKVSLTLDIAYSWRYTQRPMDAAARALAEPTRREILRLVRDDERTAGEIATHFAVTRPAISQHLRVLSDAELVAVRSEGTRRYYRARPDGLAELREWMDGFWTSSLRRLAVEVERDEWNKKKDKWNNKTAKRKKPTDD